MGNPIQKNGFLNTQISQVYRHNNSKTFLRVKSILITNTVAGAYIVTLYMQKIGEDPIKMYTINFRDGDWGLDNENYDLTRDVALMAKANIETVSFTINGEEEKV